MERSRAGGPMRDPPMGFVAALMNSVAEATMDYMVQDARNARRTAQVALKPCGE